jgi:hypothetical protein
LITFYYFPEGDFIPGLDATNQGGFFRLPVIHSGFGLDPGARYRKRKSASKTAHTPWQTHANLLRLQGVGCQVESF